MRIALITGASSGLGREYARWADAHGSFDQIWAIARREERLHALAKELSTPVRALPLDLTEGSAATTLQAILDEEACDDPSLEVGLLVNAAGFGKFGTYADMTLAEADSMVDLNCRALVDVTQVALAHMRDGGRIVQVASSASFQPLPGLNVYAASKAFVRSYTRALRFELRGHPRDRRVPALGEDRVHRRRAPDGQRPDRAPPLPHAGSTSCGALVDARERRKLPRCHLLRHRPSHADRRQGHSRSAHHVGLGGCPEDLRDGPLGRRQAEGVTGSGSSQTSSKCVMPKYGARRASDMRARAAALASQ